MDFAFICEGDTTSHGGRVLTCAPENEIDGRPLALLGDKVSCPKCGGIYPIVGVKDLGVTFDGRPVASEGDMLCSVLCKCKSIGVAARNDRIQRQRCVQQRLDATNEISWIATGALTEYCPEL
jgi:uncharacterized Zn-binding protein involved in type VI secretion